MSRVSIIAKLVLWVDFVWRLFRCLYASKPPATVDDTDSSDDENATGNELLYIEEPVGFFFPSIKKRIQHLQLDQAQHLLHYGNFKHVMRLHSISLITSIEETDKHGVPKWWMTVQDPSTLQVWVIHFPSRHRLEAWVELLNAVFLATNSRAVVSDIVSIHESPASPLPSSTVHFETIPAAS